MKLIQSVADLCGSELYVMYHVMKRILNDVSFPQGVYETCWIFEPCKVIHFAS